MDNGDNVNVNGPVQRPSVLGVQVGNDLLEMDIMDT